MSKRILAEASTLGFKDWWSILEAFRTHRLISMMFEDWRDIEDSRGRIVGRETFNDPCADCSLVSKQLFEFWKKESSKVNAAGISQQIPSLRDWAVTLVCARLTFSFTTTRDNGHLEQTHHEQWSIFHWVCVSEQSESGPFFLIQVSPYASGACLDPAVDPDTKYDPVTVIDQESKDLLCDNADKGSWKILSPSELNRVRELFGLQT